MLSIIDINHFLLSSLIKCVEIIRHLLMLEVEYKIAVTNGKGNFIEQQTTNNK